MIRISQKTWIIAVTIGLFTLPPVIDLLLHGWKRVFSYFAADTFYYLTVARNYARLGIFSFDQQTTTNGFHPLWQVLLGWVYKLAYLLHLPDPTILVIVFGISLMLIAVSIWLLGDGLNRLWGQLPVMFAILPVGIYALIAWPVYSRYGSLWSFANGMETGAVFFFFGLLVWWLGRCELFTTASKAAISGLIFGALTLARLDCVFLVGAIYLVVLIEWLQERKRYPIRWISLSGIVFLFILGGYISANLLSVGLPLPVSGMTKSSFPNPVEGLLKLRELPLLLQNQLPPSFGARAWRHLQLVVPMLFGLTGCIISLKHWLKGGLHRFDRELLIFSIFSLLLGGYNYWFVPLWDQGHWYFPIPILFTTIAAIYWFMGTLWNDRLNALLAPALSILSLLVIMFFGKVVYDPAYNQRYASFLNEASLINDHYSGEDPKLVEYDDGVISYMTGYPGMSGLGFCLDKEAAVAKKEQRLLRLAYDRGYRYITSYYYLDASGLTKNSSSDQIKQLLGGKSFLSPEEVSPFSFSVDYQSSNGSFAIIKMEKAN